MNVIFGISGLLLFLTSFILIFLLIKYGRTKAHLIWLFFNISVAFWGLGSFFVSRATNAEQAINAWKFAHVGSILIAPTFFHFVCRFCNLKFNKSILLIYLQGLIFILLAISNPHNTYLSKIFLFNSIYYLQSDSFLYLISVFFWLSFVMWGHYELYKYYKKSTLIQKNQVKYLFFGMIIGFSGGITNFLPIFGVNIFPFGNFTIPIYSLIVTYAILRYRLMDITVVIKKALIYSLSAVILTSIFVIVVLVVTEYLSGLIGISSFVITVIAALIIAFLFNPLKNKIQSVLDRTFFIKTYDYYSAIQRVSQNLATMFDPKNIYNFVGDMIFSTLGLRNIYLLSVVPGGDFRVVYKKYHGYGKDKENEDLKIHGNTKTAQFLHRSNDIVIKDEIIERREEVEKKTAECFVNTLKPFRGEAILPVFIDDKLEILCVLGEKLSGNVFTDEDIKLLNTISHQTSIALKNAKLYAEKISSERLASIGMVSATFAHEIRNPLTSIKTFAQLMPEKYTDAEFREKFSKIAIDEIGRIDRLIKDLMSISTKNVAIPKDEVDLYELVDDILDRVKVNLKLGNREIKVEKLYKKDKITVIGDSQKLQQSFMNIINNGCQAMDDNGVLTVDIKPNGQNIDVSITDIGKGISPVEINKIFDPFYTTKDRGVGLGLAISKKIVEDHGGTMTVESTLTKGTTFTASLPALLQRLT
ncbi:MAG: ATP-binding protein [Candidatus Hodarchaeales archaeon]